MEAGPILIILFAIIFVVLLPAIFSKGKLYDKNPSTEDTNENNDIGKNQSNNLKSINEDKSISKNVPVEEDEENDVKEHEDEVSQPQDLIRKHKIFHSKDETLIDILGSGFLSSLFVQESFSKSVLLLSNKRVYQRGKIFERDPKGKIVYYDGEKSVDIREITGLSFIIENPISRLVSAIVVLILSIIGFFLVQNLRHDEKTIVLITSIAFLLISIILFIVYGAKKGKWFKIEFAGGEMRTNCNWYTKKSIQKFMRNIS